MQSGKTRHGSLQIMLENYNPDTINYIVLCEKLRNKISNSKAQDTISIRRRQYQAQVLEKFYTLLKDHENLQSLSGREIIKRYGDLIFGDGKKYDVSELIDTDLITETNGTKNIVYAAIDRKKGHSVNIHTSTESEVMITESGALAYQNSNEENVRLMQYEIRRKNDFGKPVQTRVLSDIDLKLIAVDKEYREAVLELLSDNNIELSNVGEYIGVIAPRRPGDLAVGKSNAKKMKQDGALIYNVNNKYVVVKSADQATASYLFYREKELYTDKDYQGPELLWEGR